MTTRRATHANSWYSGSPHVLSSELDGWLRAVGGEIPGVGSVPVAGARIIIAPHAGYSYSGPAAAYAYASWDLSKAKRVFLLGPSHHIYLDTCALTTCTTYATPLGPLTIDAATTAALRKTGHFTTMSLKADEAEHSLEMHLPYIYKMLTLAGKPDTPLTPIMVGAISASKEKLFGDVLRPYLMDPENAFVVSTDFCHWGTRFDYTHYYPTLPALPECDLPPVSTPSLPSTLSFPAHVSLSKRSPPPSSGPEIHESIAALDRQGMAAVATGSHAVWVDYLRVTRNTVCGRHPMGVVIAGVEGVGKWAWVRYERSSEVESVGESSVSYASAFWAA